MASKKVKNVELVPIEDAGERKFKGLMKAYQDRDLFMRVDKQAPDNALCWLEGEEAMPEAACINYELTYDEFGRVYPAVAMRNTEGELIAGTKLTADEMIDMGKWAFKTAFFKLGLLESGLGGKPLLQDRATAKAILVEQVDDILQHLIMMDPGVISGRVSAAAKAMLAQEMEAPLKERVMAQAAEYIQQERVKNAEKIVTLAKIAARRKRESREEALSDPRIEKMIVESRELLDANSHGEVPGIVTR